MTKRKRIERGMLDGNGDTMTEAKEHLNGKIDAALKGSYEPTIMTHGAYFSVMYRSPRGWAYRLSQYLPTTGYSDHGCEHFVGTRDQCFQDMAFHLLDVASGPDEFKTDDDIPSFLTDRSKRSTILSNARFRRTYRWAQQNPPEGLDADDSHSLHAWACNHERDAMFV